jgi:hypothetical protein
MTTAKTPQKTIVEINGVKLEVDLRHAKRIDELRIGSPVKCLIKLYSDYKVSPGVIVGFEQFTELPSIVVAYMDVDYNGANVVFKTFNAETKDFEIIADLDNNSLEIDKTSMVDKMDREIAKHEMAHKEATQRKAFFLSKFGTFFNERETA